jgi:hypothetical protein
MHLTNKVALRGREGGHRALDTTRGSRAWSVQHPRQLHRSEIDSFQKEGKCVRSLFHRTGNLQ